MSAKPNTVIVCDHPAEGEALEPREVIQAFGEAATGMIPVAPAIVRLKNDSGVQVYLSRVPCGHIIMISPTTVAAADQKAGHPMDIQEVKAGDRVRAATEHYEDLLARAREGEEIAAADVVAAKETIALEELAEEGRRERAEDARIKEAAAARNALEVPALEELTESRDNLTYLQQRAYEALLALFDAVDGDMALQDEVADRLISAGFDQAEVHPPVQGFLRTTAVGGQEFPYWTKAEWLIGILNVVRYGKKHPNALSGNHGRDLTDRLPSPLQQGPRPEP